MVKGMTNYLLMYPKRKEKKRKRKLN